MDNQAECSVESGTAPVAPVEAKSEFVEVGGKVVREYGTFVCSQKPTLQVADDEVDHRQIGAGLLAFRGLQDAPMGIAELLQTVVSRPPISDHERAFFDVQLAPWYQRLRARVGNDVHPHPTGSHLLKSGLRVIEMLRVRDRVANDLDAADHQAFGLGAASRSAFFGAANEPLVDFHLVMKRFTVGGHQRRAEFVQELECSLVSRNTELFLELKCRDAWSQGRNEVGGMEPKHERELASMHARAGRQTDLVSVPTLGYAPRGKGVTGAGPTLRTDKTCRPAYVAEVLRALPLPAMESEREGR